MVGGVSAVTYIYGACTGRRTATRVICSGAAARALIRELDRQEGDTLRPCSRFYKPFGYEPFFHISRQVSLTEARSTSATDLGGYCLRHRRCMTTGAEMRIERDRRTGTRNALFDTLGAQACGYSGPDAHRPLLRSAGGQCGNCSVPDDTGRVLRRDML